jgi:nicotinic acid mononucleotide adenylyltransferase
VSRTGTTLSSLKSRLPDLAPRMIAPEELESSDTTRVILLEMATPDVSSTEIRARVQSGQPIDGLVPDAVATYILTQHLYRIATPDPFSATGR